MSSKYYIFLIFFHFKEHQIQKFCSNAHLRKQDFLSGKNKSLLPIFDDCKQWRHIFFDIGVIVYPLSNMTLWRNDYLTQLIFSSLKMSCFFKSMLLVNFRIQCHLNFLNFLNILMMLNKCIIQWFSFNVTTIVPMVSLVSRKVEFQKYVKTKQLYLLS